MDCTQPSVTGWIRERDLTPTKPAPSTYTWKDLSLLSAAVSGMTWSGLATTNTYGWAGSIANCPEFRPTVTVCDPREVTEFPEGSSPETVTGSPIRSSVKEP